MHDRDRARHRRFEQQVGVVLLGQRRDFDAVLGDQRLVGGHDRLARAQGCFHRALGRPVRTADQFDNHVDVVGERQLHRIIHPAEFRDVDAAIAVLVARGHGHDFQLAWNAQLGLTFDQLQQAPAHRAEASHAEPQRFPRRRHPTAFLDGEA